MHTEVLAAVAIIFGIFFLFLIVLVLVAGLIMSTFEAIRYWRLKKNHERYTRASILLDIWLEARPFLYVSQCEYASYLVWEMIESCEEAEKLTPYFSMTAHLRSLHALLNEQPPADDPPPKPRHKAGLFFLIQEK